jgi:putative DNA primase/helicase
MVRAIRPELEPGARFTDVSNAERFVRRHGDSLRFVYVWGHWMEYDGRRWQRDLSGGVERRAKEVPAEMWPEAAALADRDEKAALVKHALATEQRHRLESMIALARSELSIQPADLDADPMLVNVQNGTIELGTGVLRPPRRDDFLTKLVAVSYNPDARCDRWRAFLLRMMGGNAELVAYLQRAVGYTLTGQTVEQCLFLLLGHGANGKSVFLEALRRLFGDYARQADSSTFLERKGDGPRNDIARLVGARLVTASEFTEGRRLNEAGIKSMTGGDVVTARFLHAEHFEFTPTFKLWLAANHKPTIRGTDHGIWRRIRLIPCTVQIPKEEQDPHLLESLVAELPGILTWAVEGCILWQRQGLGTPLEVEAATAEYRAEMDSLGAFLDDRCELGRDCTTSAGELYAAYVTWCQTAGERAQTQRAFGLALTERGITALKKSGTVRRTGIRLRTKDLVGQTCTLSPNNSSRVEENPKAGPASSFRPEIEDLDDYEMQERMALEAGA